MVLPSLKYTCMPCFLHIFFILSLQPFVYGTTKQFLLMLELVLLLVGFFLIVEAVQFGTPPSPLMT